MIGGTVGQQLVTVARFTVEFFAPGFVAKNWRTFSFKLV